MMASRRIRFRYQVVIGLLTLAFPTVCLAQSDRAPRDRDRGPGAERRLKDHTMQPRLVPPLPRPPRQWYLGVRVAYRDTGAEITEVVPRSPASEAGLERRDLIVTVSGYQIGYVNGRLYPLDRELALRAGRGGLVHLLVQNRRNGTLTNIRVQLERADTPILPDRQRYLIGTVTARRTTQLPRDASLVIQLVDVSHRLGPLTPVVQKEMRDLGPLPIPFELPYDPDRIDPQRQYALRAHVIVHGLTALRTKQDYRVLDNAHQGRVQMVLERAP